MSQEGKELSGLYYPNKIARIFLSAMEDVMGRYRVNAVLNLAGLQQYIDALPPDDLERKFDFVHFTALQIALEDLYGPRAGRGLALRTGRACFTQGLKTFGAMAGASDLAFKVLPLGAKLKLGLPALASIFATLSDQHTFVEEHDDHFSYVIEHCALCVNRTQDEAVGYAAMGLLQESLRWVSGGHEFKVVEVKCKAQGDEHGVFVIYKTPIS